MAIMRCRYCGHGIHRHDDDMGCCEYERADGLLQICGCPMQTPGIEDLLADA